MPLQIHFRGLVNPQLCMTPSDWRQSREHPGTTQVD
jgi:hypothetical protein